MAPKELNLFEIGTDRIWQGWVVESNVIKLQKSLRNKQEMARPFDNTGAKAGHENIRNESTGFG